MAEEKKKTKEEIAKEDSEKFKEKNIDNVPKIIAAICPEYYATPSAVSKIKKLKKDNKFWEAVSLAKPGAGIIGRDTKGLTCTLSYNSSSESLEPVYFWILDQLEASKCEKLVDNFVSSPGSGHFSEMMGKATRMQEEGMKVMQTIGVLIKSVIQIIYDLRQFELRLNDYTAASGKIGKDKIEAGIMALKQTWLDNVDIKRGNSSIKAMTFSQQGAFTTLLNAFFAVNKEEDLKDDKFQLNDLVKRVLQQRLLEFNQWKDLSEKELRKRYNMERYWLKSQVESLKLYSRWAKPYLKAAEELKMTGSLTGSSALVKAFNTNLMQLVIMQKKPTEIQENVYSKTLPKGFEKLAEKKLIRNYTACVLVDFQFRGIPQRVEQHYAFGGKSDVIFKAYALNDEELEELTKRLAESDLNDALKLVEGTTSDSLKEIQEDIDYFLKDLGERKKEGDSEEKEEKKDDSNPFSALMGFGTFWGEKDKKKTNAQTGKSENYAEKVVRSLTEYNARKGCFQVYDLYKKAHGMASVPIGEQFEQKQINVSFSELFKR